MLRFGVGRNGWGRRWRKSRAYLWKNPDYAPPKARKNNRSLERPYHVSWVALSRKRWSRIIHDEMKTSRSFQRKNEWQQCKCNAIFAVCDLSSLGCWYVLPCGYLTFPIHGNTMLRYEQQTFTTLFCRLKSDFMDLKRFEYVRLFNISGLPSLDKLTWLVHLAGVGSLILPFLIGNGFNLYQIAV